MKVILLHNVKKVGKQGDIVDVADGYANGFLLPKKLAKVATAAAMSQLKNVTTQKVENDSQQKKEAAALFDQVKGKRVTIRAKANKEGHLFATVSGKDILVAAQSDLGIFLEPEHIVLKEGIKDLGEYDVDIAIGENKGSLIAEVISH